MAELKLGEEVNDIETSVIHLTAIVYDQQQLPAVEKFVKQPIFLENTLLFLKSTIQEGHYYIAVQVVNLPVGTDSAQMDIVKRVMGLSDEIICFELSPDNEAAVQKIYLEMLTSGNIEEELLSIHFIHSGFKKMHQRANEGIYYYQQIENLELSNEKKMSPLPKMKVKQILDIYHNCTLMERTTFGVKMCWMKFKQIIDTKKNIEEARDMILNEQGKCNSKILGKKLEKFNLPKNVAQKLEWQNRQIGRYHQLLQQDKTNAGLIKMFKSSPIYDVSNQVINLEIKHLHRNWTTNTLKVLKQSFNRIANRKDTKAVQQFRQIYETILTKLSECRNSKQLQKKNEQLVVRMEEEIKDFMDYHEEVIKGNLKGGLQYFKKEAGYLWRNNPKIYYRVGIIVLMGLLAYLQDNPIICLTIVSMGLIFSVINI